MFGESGQADLDRVLTQARQLLDSVRAGRPAAEPAEPLTGTGESADGRVRAVAATGGRLERVELDPRVLRLPSEELAGHLVTAVNAALDALAGAAAARAASAGPVAPVDTAALAEQVRQVQEDGVRRMAAFTAGISAAMAQLGRRG
jgi:DNA-binding protein YbaB